MIRIGILAKIGSDLFSNGVNQNAIFLADVLKKCGYTMDIICGDKKTIESFKAYANKINIISLELSFDIKYDIVISVGLTNDTDFSKKWKRKNSYIKFVAYKCGNDFLSQMENCLFKKELDSKYFELQKFTTKPDQIWMIPQMENTNYSFYQYVFNQEKATVVPFIWQPHLIEKTFEGRQNKIYQPRKLDRCAVMEPNMSVMKNVFFPIMMLEKNQNKNPFKQVFLFSTTELSNSKPFLDFIKSTSLYKNKIVSVESRFLASKVFSDHADLLFSWQWENNLNYLPLEVAWMGYPVIHNAYFCQDVGYYYEGFNGDQALERIDFSIKTHNENHEKYLSENRKIIERYTSENTYLVEQYKELIESVLNNKFERKRYDWKENKII